MLRPTSQDIVRATPSAIESLQPLVERATEYADAAVGNNTKRAYGADWRMFEAWCVEHSIDATRAKPAGVAVYLAWMADDGYAIPSIERAYSGIAAELRKTDPEGWPLKRRPLAITEVIRGIRRKITQEPDAKKPVTDKEIDAMLVSCGDGIVGKRNRAILLLGFFSASRRSELVALDVGDVTFFEEGLNIIVRRSKTDQGGRGQIKGVFFSSSPKRCPVRALRRWLDAANITEGPIFRPFGSRGQIIARRLGGREVANVVKAAAKAIGLDPDDFAGHSLRAGFVTTAAKKGKSLDAIMRQTGHESVATVRRYIRHATVFEDNATEGLL